VAAALVATLTACAKPGADPHPTTLTSASMSAADAAEAVLALDRKYWESEKAGDWPVVASFIAPDYYGVGDGVENDRAGMERDFPKIKLLEYQLEHPRFKLVRPDLAVVSYTGRMKEFFEGQDISGRYWYSTTWTLRGNEWKLLVEEEVRLDQPASPSN
jgi:hypothetical protein